MSKYFSSYFILIMLAPLNIFGFSPDIWISAINNVNSISYDDQDANIALKKFRKDYQLLFVYSSNCAYCHKFSNVLIKFAADTKINVASLTANGGKIAPFYNAIYDPEKISELGVVAFPTLFVEHKANKKTYLINQGLITYKELESNINALLLDLYGN